MKYLVTYQTKSICYYRLVYNNKDKFFTFSCDLAFIKGGEFRDKYIMNYSKAKYLSKLVKNTKIIICK